MALVKCEECGKEISDKTKKCVHCGNKILSEKQKIKLEIKKENKKARRKLFKIFFWIFFSIFLLICSYVGISYFFPRRNINMIDKYSDYLHYAFGDDVEIKLSSKSKYFSDFWFNEETCWDVKFRDVNNVVHEIDICDYWLFDFKNREKAIDYVFAYTLLYEYEELLETKLENSQTSRLDRHINIIVTSEKEYKMYYKNLPELIKVGGLSFKDISLEQLPSDLYYLNMDVLYSSGTNVEEYTKTEALKVINKYNIKNAFISAGIDNTKPVYCQRNGIEVTCPYYGDLDTMNNNMLDSNNYIYID